jgi:hypothetical protein
MNLKNKLYMKNKEFKARQLWLDFVDATGVALQIMSEPLQELGEWFKAWRKDFRTSRKIEQQNQLTLNFLCWIFENNLTKKVS